MSTTLGRDFWTRCGALLCALGVSFGAFGAHALRGVIGAADMAIWEKAVFYHLLHAVALTLLSFQFEKTSRLRATCVLLCTGVVIFSGSLYLLVLTQQRWLGAVTPLGGISLIAAWVWLALPVGGKVK